MISGFSRLRLPRVEILEREPTVLPRSNEGGCLLSSKPGIYRLHCSAAAAVLQTTHPAFGDEPAAHVHTAEWHHVAVTIDDVTPLCQQVVVAIERLKSLDVGRMAAGS
jgi:hypothetical protein